MGTFGSPEFQSKTKQEPVISILQAINLKIKTLSLYLKLFQNCFIMYLCEM